MSEVIKWNWAIPFALLCINAALLCGCGGHGQSLEEILAQEQERMHEEVGTFERVAETGEEIQTLWVHICGYVRTPGIYELPEGSRVFDCLMEAGGFAEGANETALNLADYLRDGSQIYVPGIDLGNENESLLSHGSIALPDQTGTVVGIGETNAQKHLVNINTASLEQLETLPGIGEKRAKDIISYRESNGPFESIEDIQKISGIKSAIFEKIKDLITVG